jgi:DNA-binding LacI/PurR family transcriptional regulator
MLPNGEAQTTGKDTCMASTMADIARMAGVSIGTVSRVINNKDKVHPKTRERIQTLIREVGYRPSAVAQSLASRVTSNIMLVVPNVADDYFGKMTQHISDLCHQYNKRVLLGVSNLDPKIEADYLKRIGDRVVDGIVISSLQADENAGCFLDLIRQGFPLVHIDGDCRNVRTNTVKYDDVAGARLAMEHLLERGHRRIAFCAATMGFQSVQDRFAGYRDSLWRAGCAFDEALVFSSGGGLAAWDGGRLRDTLDSGDPPTAILAENDVMAISCMNLIRASGGRVPEDVAVVGFNNTYPPYLAEKPLTTVALPLREACRVAIELLLDLIKDRDLTQHAPTVRVLQPELVIGKTT